MLRSSIVKALNYLFPSILALDGQTGLSILYSITYIAIAQLLCIWHSTRQIVDIKHDLLILSLYFWNQGLSQIPILDRQMGLSVL